MTDDERIKCKACHVSQDPAEYGRTRSGGKRKTCRSCIGSKISNGLAESTRQAHRHGPDEQPLRPDQLQMLAIDRATFWWAINGETR